MMIDHPKKCPYGTLVMPFANAKQEGIFYVNGTAGNGFMVHENVAADYLSDTAIKYSESFDEWLTFAEKDTAAIVVHECGNAPLVNMIYDKKEKAAMLRQLFTECPQYVKDKGIPVDVVRGASSQRVSQEVR